MTLPQNTIVIRNRDLVTGNTHATAMRAVLNGPIRRTLGASGDRVSLTVEASEWPAGWKDDGEFILIINGGQLTDALEIAGYRLKAKLPASIGNATDDPDAAPVVMQLLIELEPQLRGLRDGLGNLLNEGTLNELNENGEIDTGSASYRTIQQLVSAALSATGLEFVGAPASINSSVGGLAVDATGPLDWGNARPLEELESILARIGWSVVQLVDGTIAVRRQLRAGEPITVPAPILAVAEPYALGSTPSIRSSKLVITSGATKATTITKRSLADLEWVVYDAATDAWSVQPIGALATYKGGITPANADQDGAKTIGQLYRAVRLTGDDLTEASRFVNFPDSLDHGALLPFAGGAGVVEALCSVKLAGDQLKNTPPLDTDPSITLDGVRAISGKGVFVLPSTAEFVRVDSLPIGRRSDVRELLGTELEITFAHESNTGDFNSDYFARGYKWVNTKGAISIVEMDQAELTDALEDPNVPKVGAPFLWRVQTYDKPSDTLTTLNDDQLEAVAKQFASFYLASGSVEAGVIPLRGIHLVEPGDWGGAVSSVSYDIYANTTLISVNQHEVPRSDYERLARAAGRSVAAGIGQVQLGRSSAARGELRYTLAPQATDGAGGAGSGPQQIASDRGRERSQSGRQGEIESGLRHRVDVPTIPEQSEIFARITGNTVAGTNKWTYDWEEVRFESDQPITTGSVRKSSTYGQALNLMELLNDGVGVQGNGVDVANLDGDFAIQPISDRAVVMLRGPYTISGEDRWFFQATNAVDGSCA